MESLLYLAGLSASTDEATLRDWFFANGVEVSIIRVPTANRATGGRRCCAFIEFGHKAGAREAIAVLNGIAIDGRVPSLLTVDVAYSPT